MCVCIRQESSISIIQNKILQRLSSYENFLRTRTISFCLCMLPHNNRVTDEWMINPMVQIGTRHVLTDIHLLKGSTAWWLGAPTTEVHSATTQGPVLTSASCTSLGTFLLVPQSSCLFLPHGLWRLIKGGITHSGIWNPRFSSSSPAYSP